MKKLLSFVLALVLMVPVALAESIDLSSMSVDELIALKASIVGELMSREEIKEANIPAGSYTVGKDIPVGAYSIKTNALMVMISVTNAKGGYEGIFTCSPSEPIGKIELEDGYHVDITGGTCVFSVYSGISFE